MGRWLLRNRLVYLSAIVIVLTILLMTLMLGDYSNPRRAIFYKYHSKFDLAYVLGYLPKDYYLEYNERIIEDANNYCLLNIIFTGFPSHNHNYIILKEKINNTEEILYNSDLLFDQIQGISNLLSSQFDISVLNKYLNYNRISEKEDVLAVLCNFITDYNRTRYYFAKNYNEILKLRIVENSKECYIFLKKDFAPDFETNNYCWFDEIGLFEINLIIKNDRVDFISDQFIFGKLAITFGTENCDSSLK